MAPVAMTTAIELGKPITTEPPIMNAFLRFIACLLTAVSVHAGGKPNILFIAVDDLRPEFGAYGIQDLKHKKKAEIKPADKFQTT